MTIVKHQAKCLEPLGDTSAILNLVRFDGSDLGSAIGDLFERSFNSSPPTFPIHFICSLIHHEASVVLGYVHHTRESRYYLGGGMCVDSRAYRRLEAPMRQAIQDLGGIAHWMLDRSCNFLNDREAVFGYVGDRRALNVDLRTNFQTTRHPRLIVRWLGDIPPDADALIDEVHALGPF